MPRITTLNMLACRFPLSSGAEPGDVLKKTVWISHHDATMQWIRKHRPAIAADEKLTAISSRPGRWPGG